MTMLVPWTKTTAGMAFMWLRQRTAGCVWLTSNILPAQLSSSRSRPNRLAWKTACRRIPSLRLVVSAVVPSSPSVKWFFSNVASPNMASTTLPLAIRLLVLTPSYSVRAMSPSVPAEPSRRGLQASCLILSTLTVMTSFLKTGNWRSLVRDGARPTV